MCLVSFSREDLLGLSTDTTFEPLPLNAIFAGTSNLFAYFLFSLADNEKIKAKSMSDAVDFNAYLMRNGSQKIVFFIFYTSIIYHLAHLMKAKRLEVPAYIAFSGNGSNLVSA